MDKHGRPGLPLVASGTPAAPAVFRRLILLSLAAGWLIPALAAPPPTRPDLVVDAQGVADSLTFQQGYSYAYNCGLEQGCTLGEGFRVLLYLDAVIANVGSASLDLGSPSGNPLFAPVPCSSTRHLTDFLLYELVDDGGAVLVSNLADPPCLEDNAPYSGGPGVPSTPAHDCGDQGIQQGWSTRVRFDEVCQWLDVTDVPPGDYTLRVTVDPMDVVQESSERNNSAEVPVTVPAALPNPDLIFDLHATGNPPEVVNRYIAPGSGALLEGCVASPGYRRILRFDTLTANISQTDFVLGEPENDPRWEWSPAHGHYHFENFGDYRLMDYQGNVVAPGHKQGWYLASTDQYLFDPWVPRYPYWNYLYGISRGWGDVYGRTIPCQYVDVTSVPNGSYQLVATVNPIGVFAESDTSNNTDSIGILITEPRGTPHRPDGVVVPGGPLTVTHAAGPAVTIGYDTAACPPDAYNVYYGLNRPVSDHVYDGAVCDIGDSGNAVVQLPDPAPGNMLWFTIVGATEISSGVRVEGGHGYDSAGIPRPLSGIGFCNVSMSESVKFCSTLPGE